MTKASKLPTLEYLNECFDLTEYGVLIWKKRPASHLGKKCQWWNTRFSGKSACIHKGRGYYAVCIGGKKYPAHRIIFYMATQTDPGEHFIDHIDGCPSNNRPDNLRLATPSQNVVNFKGARADNKSSGARGVSWNIRNKRWQAWIQVEGKRVHLGLFDDVESASEASDHARKSLYGEFYVC